jgi:hypothetical protein
MSYSAYRPANSSNIEDLRQLDALYEQVEAFLKLRIKPCLVRQQAMLRLMESQLIAREILKGLDTTDEMNQF